jgi:predicted small metal-binding protein
MKSLILTSTASALVQGWHDFVATVPWACQCGLAVRQRIREAEMTRLFVDCRDYPSEKNCTIAISADSKEELVDAAVQHAIAVHGHHETPELRQELAKMIKPVNEAAP